MKENFFSQSREVVFRSLTEVIKIVGKKYYAVRGKKIDKIITISILEPIEPGLEKNVFLHNVIFT